MGAVLRFSVDWRGAGLDRLIDEGHARLVAAVAKRLRSVGWAVQFEVSFAYHGDRGSIDILAWHAATRTLLVVEVKTELGSLEGLLRPLDIKVRAAAQVARERFGWQPVSVAKLVAFPADRSVRRSVVEHDGVLAAALPTRTVGMKQWLATPVGPVAGLMFVTIAQTAGAKRNPSSVQRVRHARKMAG